MSPITLAEWENFDPTRPSITLLAKQKLPLNLPWGTVPVVIGTPFFSSRAENEAPFTGRSPFDTHSLSKTPLKFEATDGGRASFTSTSSRSAGHSTEHLSASLGISVGCKFLSAGVTGSYDEDVAENVDDQKRSLKATWRSGTVLFEQPPQLSTEAIEILKGGGLQAFQQAYGDYYVAGLQLGADSVVMVSTSEADKTTTERYAVTVRATVLVYSAEHVEDKFFTYASATSTVNLSAFDTLSSGRWKVVRQGNDVEAMRVTAAYCANLATDLPWRVEQKLKEIGIKPGTTVTRGDCMTMCRSGLIVEVVLLPVSTLREVQRHINSEIIM